MPVIHPSLNFCFRPLILSVNHLSHLSFSPRIFTIQKRLLDYRNLCSLINAESPGGRSGALAPSPVTEEAQKIDVNPPKGTRDFPPEEMRLRSWLFHNFREVRDLI